MCFHRLAHQKTLNMQKVLKNPNDERIARAFGEMHDIEKIRGVVDKLAEGKIKIQSADADVADKARPPVVNGFTPVAESSPEIKMGPVHLGSTFMSESYQHFELH